MFTRRISHSIFILALGLSLNAGAARVLQLKNGKVLIDLEGDKADTGQLGVLINADNKKVALIQINQVKNGKAIATITKGQATGTEKVTLATPPIMSGSGSTEAAPSNQVYRTGSRRYSVVASIMNNSMTTKQNDASKVSEDVAMKGNTFGLTGIVDYPVFPSVELRATLGYEPFKATGTAARKSCDNATSTNCTADISYLSAGGYLRYNFTKTKTLFWAGLGGTLKFPLAKSTTALKQDDIKMTMTYGAALGLDYFLSNKTFIPFSVEQQMFLKSDTVSASFTMIRVGYGQTF